MVGKSGQDFASISVRTGTQSKLKSKIKTAKNALVVTSGTVEMLADAAEKTNATPLAADALVAITADTNPIKSISLNTLHDVLSGKITNWKDLGGPNIDLNLYLPEEVSGVIQIANKLGYITPKSVKSQRFSDLTELSTAASSDPYGLGFTNYANRHSATPLSISGTCGAHIQPTAFNILTGSYPASYFHYLQTTSTPVPIFAREFISYLNNTQAKNAITALGYPSLSVIENALDNQGNRIAHGLLTTSKTVPVTEYRAMLNALNGARQLSTVLRFKAGSLDLDTQSSAALEVLISELFLGNYADQKLQIIGFTEADGSTGENKRNSKAAAQLISRYIKDADSGNQLMDLQIEILGYGEASPLTCEDTPEGSAINNRVEIWVKD